MKYDAIVIGSGQAGNPLSHDLADRGWKVALVERSHLGGTCINTGCTPTKSMVACAQVAHYARNGKRWGVSAAPVQVDLPFIVARKDGIVQQFRAGQQRQVDGRPNIHLYHGQAQFLGPKQLSVGDQLLESERIFINTGTRPLIPRIEGIDGVGYLTNSTLLDLKELPDHLLVLGGGYIGLEFGQMFRRFGSQVTVIHRGQRLLNREDADVVEELQKALEGEGLRFRLGADAQRVERSDGRIRLTIQAGERAETLEGSHLLVA